MTNHLLIIDPQNDFCDIPDSQLPTVDGQPLPKPALPVGGAHDDMGRLATFLSANRKAFHDITITLDSHASVAIERVSFWKDVLPFTKINRAEVISGARVPRHSTMTAPVLSMFDRLMELGQPAELIVWPVHCVTGTWGHNVHSAISTEIAAWETEHQRAALKVLKGEYQFAEHFGVFEANAPQSSVPSTQFNEQLLSHVTGCDVLYVAGEASSHCVAASVRQLFSRGVVVPKVVLLIDAMSPVTGFDALSDEFFKWAVDQGITLSTTSGLALEGGSAA